MNFIATAFSHTSCFACCTLVLGWNVTQANAESLSSVSFINQDGEAPAREYYFSESTDGLRAFNQTQAWKIDFDGHGFLVAPQHRGWTWGLVTKGVGRASGDVDLDSPSCLEFDQNKLNYHWNKGLVEWYINDNRGLEHGYTMQQRPPGSGPLRIRLDVRGSLTPRLISNRQDVAFVDTRGFDGLKYGGLTVVDADRLPVPAWFELVGNALSIVVDDTNARYPIVIDPVAQESYFKALLGDSNDRFGHAVAISDNIAVISARFEASNSTGVNGDETNNDASFSGAAYVWVRQPSGAWLREAYLKASNAQSRDKFGFAVAASGNTVVVSALQEDSGATGINGDQFDGSELFSGAVYVFVREAPGVWTQQAYIKASNTRSSAQFGRSVAMSGNTLVVGADKQNSPSSGVNADQSTTCCAGNSSGAAYVFVRDENDQWSQQAFFKASNADSGDLFGNSVAIDGDTIVVGALEERSSAVGVDGDQANNDIEGAGAAYVFFRDENDQWTQQAYLKASNTEESEFFGQSVAVSGDLIAVGAFYEDGGARVVNGDPDDNSADRSGAVYTFTRDQSGQWSPDAYIKAKNADPLDMFGYSVALYDGKLVVGAIQEASSGTGPNSGMESSNDSGVSGAAYLFARDINGNWVQSAHIKSFNSTGGNSFGHSVAIDAERILVGAIADTADPDGISPFNQNSGGAHLFQLDPVIDSDGDGIPDLTDNCRTVANANQSDDDSDGVGNLCDECPNNGWLAVATSCGCESPAQDTDGDGTCDLIDPCPNRRPGDIDGNGVTDQLDIPGFASVLLDAQAVTADEVCAADLDNDAQLNGIDLALMTDLLLGL